ncbi:aminoglycoside phosphotransferase family protein [Streptomyces sp. NPDC102360]|uniref:aminoglycoside phosphotransferase family protein n=1 Tax=Streptomyces sp. NPDC102360 TaxID=3366160 RepID=UPI0038179C40
MAGQQDPTTQYDLIGRGRTADVHALDDAWVLRRYRDGLDARGEADVMAYVRAHGFPAPRVRADPGLAPGELVLERLDGPTQLDALLRGALGAAEAGRELAFLLGWLHAVPARPGGHVLHLDLHPDNVIRTPHGPMVIDWANAEEGSPALDWAMSALILAEVAVDPGRHEARVAREALGALLAAPHPHLAEPFLAEVRARRGANPTLDADEKSRLGAAVELVRSLEGAR